MQDLKVSEMAENLIGSEIIKLGNEIKEKIAKGEKVYNFTIGDFNPELYPIPEALKQSIIDQYGKNQTNYPPADGVLPLRNAIQAYTKKHLGLDYGVTDYLVAGGSRPLIYAVYKVLVNPEENIVFPTPSWNNNHYTHLSSAQQVGIATLPENNFMPTAEEIKPHLPSAGLVALCSPLNPTGTVFTKEGLKEICEAIVEENKLRKGKKPVYLLYDQIYWSLTYGTTEHYDPVSLVPEMKDYTVFIDGMSKSFAATGVRVGWSFGPTKVIAKMKSVLGHIGAWAPKAEQMAAADYLSNETETSGFLNEFKGRLETSLNSFYEGFKSLKEKGYAVDAIAPQAAIYLTVKIDLVGKKTQDGKTLESMADVTSYILEEAKTAMVPFGAFGADRNTPWYRISVGTAAPEDISNFFKNFEAALEKLS